MREQLSPFSILSDRIVFRFLLISPASIFFILYFFIKELENSWKIEEEERQTDRQKKERLNKKQQAEKRYKEKATEKQIQQKISDTWKRIPEHEQLHLLKEEEKKKRLELREIKVNVWKKWRKESIEKRSRRKAENPTRKVAGNSRRNSSQNEKRSRREEKIQNAI